MMVAKDAREMVTKAIEAEVVERENKAKDFCNNLDERIMARAKEKYTHLKVEVEIEIKSYVIQILRNNGYVVESKSCDNTITLMW